MKNKAIDLIFRFPVDTSGGVEEEEDVGGVQEAENEDEVEGNGEARCVLHGPLNDEMEVTEKADCSALKVMHSLFFSNCSLLVIEKRV